MMNKGEAEQNKECELNDKMQELCAGKGISFRALECAADAGKIAQDYEVRGEALGEFMFELYQSLAKKEGMGKAAGIQLPGETEE